MDKRYRHHPKLISLPGNFSEVFQVDSQYGRYWRAVTFDQYTGSGWVSSASETKGFQPGDSQLVTMPMETRLGMTTSYPS